MKKDSDPRRPEVRFSVNSYDHEGDCYERGIYLHFGETRIKVGEDLEDFKTFIATIFEIEKEISENY